MSAKVCPRWLVASVCILLLAATSPLAATSSRALKTALLLEHGESSAWTELLRAGLDDAARDFNIQPDVIILPDGQGQKEAFITAVSNNDLVLVASDTLHELVRDNAANFRRVKFGVIDAGIRASNVMSITFADEQAAFLAGATAALVGEAACSPGQNVIAWLSGADTPAMRSLFNGFCEGAELAVPGTRIIQSVTGSFTDGAKAARKMEDLVKAGAKVVVLASGSGNSRALDALGDAPVYIIAVDGPLPASRPAGVIEKTARKAAYEIIASAANGRFGAKEVIVMDLANRGVDFTGLEKLKTSLPGTVYANIVRRVAELRQELEKGGIKLRSLRQRTLCDCLD